MLLFPASKRKNRVFDTLMRRKESSLVVTRLMAWLSTLVVSAGKKRTGAQIGHPLVSTYPFRPASCCSEVGPASNKPGYCVASNVQPSVLSLDASRLFDSDCSVGRIHRQV